jgi:hypothetical protein
MYRKAIIAVAAATIIGMPGSASAIHNDRYNGPSNSESARYQGNPLPWWWKNAEGGFASAIDQPAKPRGKGHPVKR